MGADSRPQALLAFSIAVALLLPLCTAEDLTIEEISMDRQTVQVRPSHPGESCNRVRVVGASRLLLQFYASHWRVTLKPPDALPGRPHGRIEVCVHRNSSQRMCQCKDDEWQPVIKGNWSTVTSPYDISYIDIKRADARLGPITITAEEEFQMWRVVCLGIGFLLLLLAPVISSWVPFYYSTYMALGVLLFVLIILYQGMKLLPLGRKNSLYLIAYGSAIGIGSVITRYFSSFVNSILLTFGLGEEMHNPVFNFLVLLIFVGGAALGYWMVRKFVLSEDGSVDSGVAQFVKLAMRVFSAFFILQSTIDLPSAVAALIISWCICFFITSRMWMNLFASRQRSRQMNELWRERARQASASYRQAEFLGRAAENPSRKTAWQSPTSPYSSSYSAGKGKVYSSPRTQPLQQQDYYSSFHKTPRRRFTKGGWEDFTKESTEKALTEWAATPEVAKWVAENAHRMRLSFDSCSDDDDESGGSSSGSSEETMVENGGGGLNLLKWY